MFLSNNIYVADKFVFTIVDIIGSVKVLLGHEVRCHSSARGMETGGTDFVKEFLTKLWLLRSLNSAKLPLASDPNPSHP